MVVKHQDGGPERLWDLIPGSTWNAAGPALCMGLDKRPPEGLSYPCDSVAMPDRDHADSANCSRFLSAKSAPVSDMSFLIWQPAFSSDKEEKTDQSLLISL